MFIQLIIASILILSLSAVGVMLYQLKRAPVVRVPFRLKCKLVGSGVVAFIADTIGIGSFAVNIAMAKLLGTFEDDELPAMNNGAQVIPGVLESIFFMKLIDVDMTTLITLVAGTCVGGVIGGRVVSRLSKQAIRLAMVVCFLLIISLLVCHQFKLLPVGGDLIALDGWRLTVGFFAMAVCGALTSVGIGLFAMVQGVLFLLNVSPAVAFPIMTTAGAMQQPLTTLMFLQQKKIPLKKTLILSLGGCIGVLLVLPVFKYLTASWLHSLLILILFYNVFAIGRAYLRARSSLHGMMPSF